MQPIQLVNLALVDASEVSREADLLALVFEILVPELVKLRLQLHLSPFLHLELKVLHNKHV